MWLNMWPLVKQQDSDEGDGGPEIAVLDDGEDVRCGDGEEGDEAEDGGSDDGDFDVVYWAHEGRVWAVGEMTTQPGVNWVGFVGATKSISLVHSQLASEGKCSPSGEVESYRLCIRLRVRASRRLEEQENGSCLQHQLSSRLAQSL